MIMLSNSPHAGGQSVWLAFGLWLTVTAYGRWYPSAFANWLLGAVPVER